MFEDLSNWWRAFSFYLIDFALNHRLLTIRIKISAYTILTIIFIVHGDKESSYYKIEII